MALYKESHKIKVFEPNEITLNAVQGEGNEREYEFRLIEKSGDTLKTSNAQVTDKMLDVTGCSVRLYVAKPDGCIVYMDGSISDAPGGIISFIPKQQVFAAAGKANCILQVTSANGDLRAIGVTLNIGKANIDGALESNNELTALTNAIVRVEKLADDIVSAVGQVTDNTEVIAARGDEALLSDRLRKIESGERIYRNSVTKEKLSPEVLSLFMEENDAEPKNQYDATSGDFLKGKYYNGGVLNTNSKIDSMFFDVEPGDKISASGFKFVSQYSSVGGGVRTAFFNGGTWVKDLTAQETYNKDFVVVPDGITRVSIPFWIDDTARSFYNYSHKLSAIEKINRLSKDVYTTEIKAINLYDDTKVIKSKYYKEGVLINNPLIDTMPLLDVSPGDKITASSFNFYSAHSQAGGGVRVGFFNGGTWVKDLLTYDTYQKEYIIIPDGVNRIAMAYWTDDRDRTLYNLTSPDTEETRTSAIEAAIRAEKKVDALAEIIGGGIERKEGMYLRRQHKYLCRI